MPKVIFDKRLINLAFICNKTVKAKVSVTPLYFREGSPVKNVWRLHELNLEPLFGDPAQLTKRPHPRLNKLVNDNLLMEKNSQKCEH